MYICPVKALLAPAPWDYRYSSWKSRQQESGLNENSQAHVLHCSHTINAEKLRTWHCRTALDSCRVYQGGWPCEHSSTCVGVRALQCRHEWSRPDHLELKANKDYSYFYKKKKTHRLQCLLLSFKVKCTLSTTNQPWKHGVLVHRRSFLISLQLSQQSSLHRLLSAPSSSVRYDPGAATGRLVDRRHRFSLPGHVHIHFRQTVGQVTIAVHLGEPGEPRTTRLYWMWWTGPDWTLDLSICGHHLCSRIWTTVCLDLVLKLHCTSDSI